MNLEDKLKSVRLGVATDGLRDRVLRATGAARFERRVWDWTAAAAAAILVVAIPLNLAPNTDPEPGTERGPEANLPGLEDAVVIPRYSVDPYADPAQRRDFEVPQ